MIPLHDDNPTTIRPLVTITIIVLCVLVFLWELSLGPEGLQRAVYAFGAIPAVLFDRVELNPALAVIPAELTLVTSMFMHGGWMHLISNMLYLWIFGNNIEDAMGHGRFILFYLLCGLAAALAHAALDPGSRVPMIGASGAISGVLGAYLLLYPHARRELVRDGAMLVGDAAGLAYPQSGEGIRPAIESALIAAAVIGGTSLKGGRGTVTGVLFGALIMTSLLNGMTLLAVSPELKYIARGSVLILAVWMDVWLTRRNPA